MTRPNVCFLASLGVLVGYILSYGVPDENAAVLEKLIVAASVAFLACGAGNVINDYFDHKIDRINAPSRPIPKGLVNRRTALWFYALLSVISTAMAAYVSVGFFAIALANVAVLSAYGWRLKRHVQSKNATVSWLSSSSFLAGALVGGNFIIPEILVIFSIAFVGTLSREMFKDVEDFYGDKKQNMRTMATVFGRRNASKVAALLGLIAIALVAYPCISGMYPPIYLVAVSPGLIAGAAAVLYMGNPHRSQRLLKVSMYCVIAAFIFMSLV